MDIDRLTNRELIEVLMEAIENSSDETLPSLVNIKKLKKNLRDAINKY